MLDSLSCSFTSMSYLTTNFILCRSVMLDSLSCSFTSMSYLTTSFIFCRSVMLDGLCVCWFHLTPFISESAELGKFWLGQMLAGHMLAYNVKIILERTQRKTNCLTNKRSTYKKKRHHPSWNLWASCFFCVLMINKDINVLEEEGKLNTRCDLE